ncbi:hypothetical protein AURDEDRAFT_140900 [Auricularia subglabra TFB-10046 SS5]|nr:hypothetical protein AURDEDRAFT_140900 [Auricularia subglabra TFB-10046 SS5]
MRPLTLAAPCLIFTAVVRALPGTQLHSRAKKDVTVPDPSLATSVQFAGQTLVAFGLIPSDAKDSFGETLGGLGSAIAVKRGEYSIDNGTFSGVLVLQPDRGHNIEAPIDWQGRFHTFDFVLQPYYAKKKLSFTDAQQTLQLEYVETRLFSDREDVPVSGADGLAIRAANATFEDPILPIPSVQENHVCFDPEGVVQNADGSYWVSDEYGPTIHLFDSTGRLIHSMNPPDAVLPRKNGAINFTSLEDPDTGRAANQGFEGLAASSDGNTLYGLLQSALMQDGGSDKTTNRHARLFAWDVSSVFASGAWPPPLAGEWVVPLPQSDKGKTFAQSELHFLNGHQFLVLARDGDGHGDDDLKSAYKGIDLVDISNATNILGLFDGPTDAVAPGGKLRSGVVPAAYQSFVSLIEDDQLKRFGLHNGKPENAQLIDAKWESIALAPVQDLDFPDDYFLFTVSDNDFQTTDGIALGEPYDDDIDVDTQILVFRVSLPSVQRGSVEQAIGLGA